MEKKQFLPFHLCYFSPVGAKMEVFVLAGSAWELRLELGARLQGLCDWGRAQAGLLLLSTEIVRSPGSVCQEQVVTQAATEAALPPTATARRQHSRRQGEERCSLVYCQSLSEMPHVFKTLPSAQQRLFDSRVLLFLCETQKWLRARGVSWSGSCFQTTKVRSCDKM